MNQEKAQPTDNLSPGGGPSAAALFTQAAWHHQRGQLEDAESRYRDVLALDPNHPDSLHYLGVIAHQRGKNDLAVDLIGKAIAANGQDSQSHYHFALVSGALGRPEDAMEHYRKAIALFPSHVSAHLNVAVLLLAKAEWNEAEAHCRRVLELAPNHPGALNSLGLAFQGMKRLDQAAASFQAALQAKPDLIETLRNLATLHLDAGRPDEAIALLIRALKVREDVDTKRLLAVCLTGSNPPSGTDTVRDLVRRALSEGWTWPDDLMRIAASLVKTGPAKAQLRRACDAWPAPLPARDFYGAFVFESIAADLLLRALLETTSVSDVELERLLTGCRAAMLELAGGADAGDLEHHQVLEFCCALARQCFINEYVWSFGKEEIERARRLRDAIGAALRDGKPVHGSAVAAVAAYFPLHSFDEAGALAGKSWPDPVAALLTQQIREPQAERDLRASMPQLTPIEDEVSRAVQQQYEENPFPRWVKLARPARARTLNRTLREMFPLSGFVEIERDEVEFLIAGCGTGQQSNERAQAFAGAKFTAVDLSMASLCYAKRKTHELGIASIDYAQADILKLGSIGRQFDAIESSGVLVAIGDPWGAWRTLLSLLKAGGVMSIGLYSELARRNIVAAQKYLAAKGYRANDEDIRRGRQAVMALEDGSPVKAVTAIGDFFNMSNCRDMLFHVQEHRFTLPQIKDFLAENGLLLLGFTLGSGVHRRYAERFPDDPARTNLDHWHQFEHENPDTFISMYNFWVQKPCAVPTSTEAHGRT